MRRRGILAVVLVVVASGCVRNPVSGHRQVSLVSEKQEIELGKEAAAQVQQTYAFVADPNVQSYVSKIGKEMAAKSERPALPWEFHVVDDASVNAFALPGGHIYVTRGLMTYMTNEAELAGVVGHEIGHVTARHSAQQITKAQFAQLGLGIGSIISPTFAKFSQLAGVGAQLMFLKFGRDDERQADELGFKYMLNDRYDPRQMPEVFKTLARSSGLEKGGKLPEWLSTHPDPENRVAAAQDRLKNVTGNLDTLKVDRDPYLSHLNGMVFGENPRQGFFRGTLFLHPDLKFQIQFPQGWQTANTPQAVMAAPKEGNAVIQLGVAGQMSPEEAAQKFLSQQGLQPGQAARDQVNGLPAVTATFAAQTDQGVIEGLTTFLSYGGTTYQLLGLAPQGQLAQQVNTFKPVFASFGPLTDPAALNVQPAKVELVKVPSAMTIEQFAQQFPSSQPAEVLAVINGVEKGAQIPAGTMLKRVVGGVPPQK